MHCLKKAIHPKHFAHAAFADVRLDLKAPIDDLPRLEAGFGALGELRRAGGDEMILAQVLVLGAFLPVISRMQFVN